jgi:hypothetical protein
MSRAALYPHARRPCASGNVSGDSRFSLCKSHVDVYTPPFSSSPRAIMPGRNLLFCCYIVCVVRGNNESESACLFPLPQACVPVCPSFVKKRGLPLLVSRPRTSPDLCPFSRFRSDLACALPLPPPSRLHSVLGVNGWPNDSDTLKLKLSFNSQYCTSQE